MVSRIRLASAVKRTVRSRPVPPGYSPFSHVAAAEPITLALQIPRHGVTWNFAPGSAPVGGGARRSTLDRYYEDMTRADVLLQQAPLAAGADDEPDRDR